MWSRVVALLFCARGFFFFFNDTATTEIYTLSLHDALPISTSIALGSENDLGLFARTALILFSEAFPRFIMSTEIGRAHV